MSRFEQFIKHRQYLMSVTDNTIRWHRCALKWLPNENPTQEQIQQMVIRMTKRKTDMCTAHPERRVVNNEQCRLCRDQSQMRDRWKKIREALKIAARYGAKSASDASTIAEAEKRLIVTLTIKMMPFKSTHSHGSSVRITKNKAAHQLRPLKGSMKHVASHPLSA